MKKHFGLTAKWSGFTLQRVNLHAKQFWGSHTSKAIPGAFEDVLQKWDILKSSVHIVLWGNLKYLYRYLVSASTQKE